MVGSREINLSLVYKRIAEKALDRCIDQKYYLLFSKNAYEMYRKRKLETNLMILQSLLYRLI